jgi:hypothetical protein
LKWWPSADFQRFIHQGIDAKPSLYQLNALLRNGTAIASWLDLSALESEVAGAYERIYLHEIGSASYDEIVQ